MNYNIVMVNKAFSLIELMVIIAIAAILMVVAVPVYKSYLARSAIVDKFNILNKWTYDIKLYFEANGEFPQTMDFMGTTINANVDSGPVNLPTDITNKTGIQAIEFFTTNGVIYTQVVLDYTKIHLPPLPSGTHTIRQSLFLSSNNVWKFHCGLWAPNDVNEVPIQYQPSICTCTDMAAAYFGSPTCT